jgi:hypothetical protein
MTSQCTQGETPVVLHPSFVAGVPLRGNGAALSRCCENGERHISTWVSTGAALALNRLARRYG